MTATPAAFNDRTTSNKCTRSRSVSEEVGSSKMMILGLWRSAREHDDERHICPLQLEVIRRGVMLWTNPGDIVLSPFMGIGSEGYVSLELGRRFVGVELKHSYYRQAASNLASVAKPATADLFSTEAA